MFHLFAGNAGWSLWVPGACSAPCGQSGTAVATRKCRGPSECCPGEGKRTEVCTSPPCQGRWWWDRRLIISYTKRYSYMHNFRCHETHVPTHTHTHTHIYKHRVAEQYNRKCNNKNWMHTYCIAKEHACTYITYTQFSNMQLNTILEMHDWFT